MKPKKEYEKKCTNADKVAELVKNGDWVDYGHQNSYPFLFDKTLANRVEELKGVKIRTAIAPQPIQCIEKDPTGNSFWLEDHHQSRISARYASMNPPRSNYMPVNFNEVPRYYRENNIKADITVLSVTPMDSKGYFNFGTNTTFSKALMEKAKIKVLEVNESMPWAYGGYDECIHISDVDYIIENSEDKITETTC